MYFSKTPLTVLLLHGILKIYAENCNTFNNARVEIYVSDNRTLPIVLKRGYFRQVSGCLSPNVLDPELYFMSFARQDIPILRKDSIRDFERLDELYLTGNNIHTLEEDALYNLPTLRRLYLTRNFIKEIPDNFFRNLNVQELGFDNNEIDYISSTAFRGTTRLKWVYAGENELTTFNREWFRDATDLEGVHMRNNRLRSVPRNAFYRNRKLRDVDLSANVIDTIEAGAFDGIHSLKSLNLTYNYIKHLGADSFPIGIEIAELLLEANRLNFLPDALLTKVAIDRIYVDGNPWKCPCLTRLLNNLRATGVAIVATQYRICSVFAKCVVPKRNHFDCYDVYDTEATDYFYGQQVRLKDLTKEFRCLRFD